ncbi:MAG: alpha-ketoacid dehydrogenase subunit beta [Desulfobacterales bacterium]
MPWTSIYADKDEFQNTFSREGLRGITYREAVREALDQILEEDNRTFLIGEGVDDPGGIFGSTLGLSEKYGKDRVMDIPIAENGLTGVAIGAAIAGMKPVFIHMRMDFLPMCMDQIVNHAAKWYYMSGGVVNVPLVIRCIIGRGWGSAAQHSQALHALFTHIPGLKVIMPATPYDVKGLLFSAIQDGNPIIFIEHRWLYDYTGFVPEERYTIPIGEGIVRRKGKDITVVALSHMVVEACKAANILKDEGIDMEVIDPRTLNPLDEHLIIKSVKKTGHLVIADVACRTGGVGAEIACRVSESAHADLKSGVRRINFPDAPTPCSPALEEAYYPDAGVIVRTVKECLENG